MKDLVVCFLFSVYLKRFSFLEAKDFFVFAASSWLQQRKCAWGGEKTHILLGEKEVTAYNIITLKGPIIQIIVFSIGNL